MKKRNYERPTMKVVKLHHRTSLLVGSVVEGSVQSQRSSYGAATEETWE